MAGEPKRTRAAPSRADLDPTHPCPGGARARTLRSRRGLRPAQPALRAAVQRRVDGCNEVIDRNTVAVTVAGRT